MLISVGHILVVIVELLKSTSARSGIPVLNKIFVVHGMPEILKSDSGPPFQIFEFKKSIEYCHITRPKAVLVP